MSQGPQGPLTSFAEALGIVFLLQGVLQDRCCDAYLETNRVLSDASPLLPIPSTCLLVGSKGTEQCVHHTLSRSMSQRMPPGRSLPLYHLDLVPCSFPESRVGDVSI